MFKYRSRVRIFLVTFVLGLLGGNVYEQWMTVTVDLPVIQSETPLSIRPQLAAEMPRGGGGSGGRERKSLQGIDLRGARITTGDFAGAEISDSSFNNADLRGADFSEASILYSSFIGANLTNADLTNAKVASSDLSNAILVGSKFKRANLSHSDLNNASVTNVDFTDANLSDADLQYCRGLTYKQISEAVINEHTSLPSDLLSKRTSLIEMSKKRAAELRRQMPPGESEIYFNEFDFLD